MSIVVNNETLVSLAPQSVVPQAEEGGVYFDDGTNTDHGSSGLRTFDGSDWIDVAPYREGTWVATIGDGTNNFTTSLLVARYVLIGRECHVDVRITWTGKGSASGNIVVNMPFAPDGTGSFRSGLGVIYNTDITYNAAMNTVSMRTTTSTNFNILESRDAATGANLTDASFGTSGEFQISGTYKIATIP